ncbi:hypothetical protein MMC21_000911 [Puttea exsequens]|nr:hypothetical protein [Puttea exsequens]
MPASSLKFLELLPAKAYIPPDNTPARQAQLKPRGPLIDTSTKGEVMPTEDMILAQVTAIKRRSSSTSSASAASRSSISHEGDKNVFLPLADLEE